MDGGGTDAEAIEPLAQAAFCAIAKPISWSKADSEATVAEIKEHNKVGKALCGWGR